MNSTAEIMEMGMACLLEKLGALDTERFISAVLREKSDYTKWRKKYFADVDLESFNRAAVEYCKKNPLHEG